MVEFSSLEVDINDVLQEVNIPHMEGSLNLANASRDSATGREGNWRWIGDITQLSWDQPFFRTVDGSDHINTPLRWWCRCQLPDPTGDQLYFPVQIPKLFH